MLSKLPNFPYMSVCCCTKPFRQPCIILQKIVLHYSLIMFIVK